MRAVDRRRMLALPFLGALLATCTAPAPPSSPAADLTASYLERYFATFPSRATAAGRHDRDGELEDLSPEILAAWVAFNRQAGERARALLDGDLDADDRLDLELLLRQTELQVFDFAVLRRAQRDPLFWTGVLGNATVFLLVRDDHPLAERLESAVRRAEQIPRLTEQARQALAAAPADRLAAELCALAERQARASATFYDQGFPRAAAGLSGEEGERLRAALAAAGRRAAAALAALAEDLAALGRRAAGDPRLGAELYAERFRLVTGVTTPVAEVLAQAESALAAKRAETAAYGRQAWPRIFPERPPPAEDVALIRTLFARLSEDRAADTGGFVAQYRRLIDELVDFVTERSLITLPLPLTLHTDRSPPYFVGQSVGGVYPAGPYAPEADTLFFLPAPPEDATAEQREAFFRDFNDHFNRMIAPHELIPGHYLQLKLAARHPRKVRALFADGVYVEGWGTFCERLLLDLGWGGPLDRLAHLKKQLENVARTIVDVRVHRDGMSRDEVLRLVREEALQDEQFAANMWIRAITSTPQLTTYFLGYQQVWSLYEDVRAARGDAFDLRSFLDGMMALGPVPVRHYRARMLEEGGR